MWVCIAGLGSIGSAISFIGSPRRCRRLASRAVARVHAHVSVARGTMTIRRTNHAAVDSRNQGTVMCALSELGFGERGGIHPSRAAIKFLPKATAIGMRPSGVSQTDFLPASLLLALNLDLMKDTHP